MGKRKKAERLGIVDRIINLYTQGKTLDEIKEILNQEGWQISRSAIHRTVVDHKEAAKKFQEASEQARVLLETVLKDPTNTSVIEAIQSMLAQRLFEYTKSIEELEFATPEEFISAVSKLARAQVATARLRLEYQKGYEAAKQEVLQQIRTVLHEPEVINLLEEKISKLEP